MAYYDGDFDQFLEDRLKRCKTARFSNAGARPQPKTGKNRSFKFNHKLVWLAVSYLVVIGLLFSSFGTAYAAKDSLPNEPLYAVKLAGEDLQLFLTSDTNARISLLTTFSNRRADEATILASQGQPVPEQVSALIDEYQEEIATLSVSTVDPRRPRDRDNGDDLPERNLAGNGEQEEVPEGEQERNGDPEPESIYETTVTLDLEIPDPSVSVTGTIGISGTMHMTPTRAGESYGPGPCETPGSCTPPEDVHSPGPYTYSYYDDEAAPPHAPGIHEGYGPGNGGVAPQQPPSTNTQVGSGSSNQPTENKGKKP